MKTLIFSGNQLQLKRAVLSRVMSLLWVSPPTPRTTESRGIQIQPPCPNLGQSKGLFQLQNSQQDWWRPFRDSGLSVSPSACYHSAQLAKELPACRRPSQRLFTGNPTAALLGLTGQHREPRSRLSRKRDGAGWLWLLPAALCGPCLHKVEDCLYLLTQDVADQKLIQATGNGGAFWKSNAESIGRMFAKDLIFRDQGLSIDRSLEMFSTA